MHESDSSRRFGVLLPISSLPGDGLIGTLGAPARRWLQWLRQAGAKIWQVLPVGPPGYGNSPYSSQSSFAASPQLLSIEDLLRAGWVDEVPETSTGENRTDYAGATRRLEPILRRAWAQLAHRTHGQREALEAYCAHPNQAAWLDDWCLFTALKSEHDGASWLDWPAPLRLRQPEALEEARSRLAEEIGFHRFVQFLLAEQADALRGEAERLGIELLGDLPFYPALDSADVWARPDLFDRTQLAGVPPDAFSATGQLWGNPLYRWKRHADDGYQWWSKRIAGSLRFVHWLRIDHFRAFVDYWAVPAGAHSAASGQWLQGPGRPFFDAMRERFGELPFVAEDLGIITDEVRALRQNLGIRGMRILQFGFETVDSEHAPGRVPRNSIVYTGTHDNDTTRGWFSQLEGAEKRRVFDHLAEPQRPHWSLLRMAMESPADWAIAPVQDLLGLASDARLNTPGHPAGQWAWRLDAMPSAELADELRSLAETTGRLTAADSPAT